MTRKYWIGLARNCPREIGEMNAPGNAAATSSAALALGGAGMFAQEEHALFLKACPRADPAPFAK